MGFFDETKRQATFKSCAHCGSTHVEFKKSEYHDCSAVSAICRKCGMRTKTFRFITGDDDSERRATREARDAWNRRVESLI